MVMFCAEYFQNKKKLLLVIIKIRYELREKKYVKYITDRLTNSIMLIQIFPIFVQLVENKNLCFIQYMHERVQCT